MGEAFATARAGIQEKLDALTERMEEAQEPLSESWLWRQVRYQELLAQVDAAVAALAQDGAPAIAEAQGACVGLADEHAEQMGRAALGKAPAGVEVAWHRLPEETLKQFVGVASDGTPLADLIGELAAPFRDTLREGLIQGIALGQNPREIARRVAPGVDSFRARIETICRTEVLRAAREATRQNYRANNDAVEGWVWLSAADGRTCAACWAMHGSLHTLDEKLDDHPNGRCVATPRTKSWAEITGDAGLPDTRPAIPTGEELFGTLTPEQQSEILGPGMWELWSSGQVPFGALVTQEHDARWGSMRRAATQAEALAGAV